MNEFFAQIFGAGPGGLGVAVAADTLGVLPELLSRGVVWLDLFPRQGGTIGKFGSTIGNSPAIDHVEGIGSSGLFAPVLKTSIGRWFIQQGGAQPELARVGELMRAGQNCLATLVEGFPQSAIIQDQVAFVHWNGTNFVSFSQDGRFLTKSKKVVFATGAREVPTLKLKALADAGHIRLVLSGDILSERISVTEEEVTIFGSSHAMAATVSKLHHVKKIVVLGRNSLRIFYPSEEVACRDGYQYRPEEVCKRTGRVWRFGGMRNPHATEVLRRLKEGTLIFAQYEIFPEVKGLVIQATGQVANRIPIYGDGGQLIGPRMRSNGHVFVDPEHCIYDLNGNIISGAQALGLGHQPGASPELGGEQAYKGSVTAVNLCFGLSGQTVVRGLLGI